MTATALPPRPLEEIVDLACRACQHTVRSIKDLDEDLRREARLIMRRPDSPTSQQHKDKIVELKAQKAVQRERLSNHVEHDH